MQKLDPDVVTNFLDFQALGLIYDTLVKYNSKLQLTPDLATSWKFSNGNKTLTFQLRKNVTFTDGTPFNSANVVASLNRVKDPKTADASASFISTVTKVVPDGRLRREARALAAGHLGARRPHLGQPGDALDRRRSPPARSRRRRSAPARSSSSAGAPNNSFTVKANPSYWGGKVTLPRGRDQDDPERAVDRLGARRRTRCRSA